MCVYEGERSRTDENNLLGKFTISGIERAKRGVPKIDVSFALDSNGILQVTARDQTTMAEARIEIERSGRSSGRRHRAHGGGRRRATGRRTRSE